MLAIHGSLTANSVIKVFSCPSGISPYSLLNSTILFGWILL